MTCPQNCHYPCYMRLPPPSRHTGHSRKQATSLLVCGSAYLSWGLALLLVFCLSHLLFEVNVSASFESFLHPELRNPLVRSLLSTSFGSQCMYLSSLQNSFVDMKTCLSSHSVSLLFLVFQPSLMDILLHQPCTGKQLLKLPLQRTCPTAYLLWLFHSGLCVASISLEVFSSSRWEAIPHFHSSWTPFLWLVPMFFKILSPLSPFITGGPCFALCTYSRHGRVPLRSLSQALRLVSLGIM